MVNSRRQFLKRSAGAAALALLCGSTREALAFNSSVFSEKRFTVKKIKRTTVRLEYRETPRRSMDRELPHWRYGELCSVTLDSGDTGTGETMLYYTWGVPDDEDVNRVLGKNALEVMWDDSLGAGLQMGLFDAVGRAAGVPVHALLGHKVHETTPLSWWNIDTPARDMASECQLAFKTGYMSYKTKGRPWFDIFEQLEASTQNLPEKFKIDMDFNDTLLTAEQGMPIIKGLEKYPHVDIYETPIPQSDVQGNRKIVEASRVNVAMHYGTPKPAVVAKTGCCDGFVVGGGASHVMQAGRFAGEVGMPFWLQLVGAGLTAAYSLHFGGVLQQARWPAVNCHQLFEKDLLAKPIKVAKGHANVPDAAGIGYEIDWDLVNRLTVQKPESRPEPERLIETTWASGRRMYTASNGKVNFMLTAGQRGQYPYFEKGADSRLVPDDGSARWKQLYQQARVSGPTEA